jgi:hypothetical protein
VVLPDEYLRCLRPPPSFRLALALLEGFAELVSLKSEDLGLPGVGLALVVQLVAL